MYWRFEIIKPDWRRKALTFLLYIFLLAPLASAQTKQKAEKDFVKELNSILKTSKEQHWSYNGIMTIDSTFAINEKGVLSVAVRYRDDDSSVVRTRMEAPVNKISRIAYDLYLILEYKQDEVTVYESEVNSKELKETHKTNYFFLSVGVSPTEILIEN